MEPIINPLWFYLIDVVDGVKSTSTLVETHMILHEYKTKGRIRLLMRLG